MAEPTTPPPTTCCIIGGGPAGIMLGFLLARSGIHVTVLEKHTDFFRDFRGDTIHPSTLELMYELGLLDKLLAIRHSRIDHTTVTIGHRTATLADFTHLPTHAKFVALMPQWDFLNFLAAEAAHFPTFTLRMGCEATGLIQQNGVTTGVLANTPEGPVEIPATLTVGCDGRHAISRDAAHLNVIDQGVPIDVLWLRLSRKPSDAESGLGYVNYGRLIVLINRIDYFQLAYIIAKGSFAQIQQQGIEAFQQSITRIVPFLADRVAEIDSWDKVKLLTVQVNHLERWSSPGLLCIGDAAHAMSPVGGIGINIALQDAVAAANILTEALHSNALTPHHLQQVQHYREKAVRRTQAFQVFAHRILNRVLNNPGPVTMPLTLRILTRIPGFQHLTARFIGLGLQPQHIKTQPATPKRVDTLRT
ncbi:FAD-dependent oxidoreductase [Edaphobacter sp.]|uniref:FAD-dependent oxidoreductase n=1 Tax=Edaphobacter sp. TaxID=1934404 RepID=UPI002DBAD3BA|nr:FAD-dependent oxidoreductase [Edaphobacter sp.]HEU5340104.1 FAD-dependent oxidoreductase [Edaphobacter sp.]